AAEAEVQEAMAQAQVILDDITLAVTLAYRSMLAARERIDLARPAVEQARENLRLRRGKYRNGNRTPADIRDAETTLTPAPPPLPPPRPPSRVYKPLPPWPRWEYAPGGPRGSLPPRDAPEPAPELPPPPRPVPKEP